MRATGSPFQAKSSQEQKEQWIWWQCQHPAGQRETDLTAAGHGAAGGRSAASERPARTGRAADACTGAADAPSAVRRHHAAHESRSGANGRFYILRHQHARLVRQVIRIEIRILQRNPPRVKILQPRCADALQ